VRIDSQECLYLYYINCQWVGMRTMRFAVDVLVCYAYVHACRQADMLIKDCFSLNKEKKNRGTYRFCGKPVALIMDDYVLPA
jgi:hypothetical protein